jgi:hypothetical protein
MVTRLATECITWDCQYEEDPLTTLVPESPIANMEFGVLTAYDRNGRLFYTVGNEENSMGTRRLYTTTIAGNVSSIVGGDTKISFAFPSAVSVLVSLEVTHDGIPLTIFQDGTLALLNRTSGTLQVVANVCPHGNSQLTQATHVDLHNRILYLATQNGSNFVIITVDMRTWNISQTVTIQNIQPGQAQIVPFDLVWIPEINNLILFSSNSQWDQLIYVSPTTGNASFAVQDLMNYNNLEFHNNLNTKTDDTYKNVAYDELTHTLYFQASQVDEGGLRTTCLVSAPPFLPGSTPSMLDWVNINLEPLDFGYQGMQYVHCHPYCPT